MLLIAACFLVPLGASAEEFAWRSATTDLSASSQIFSEPRNTTAGLANTLPDGLIALPDHKSKIEAAWYTDPTMRYRHGILGDATEAGGLAIKLSSGEVVQLTLSREAVFEDRYPRLHDLNGDGTTEIITIKSSRDGGGSVTVYGLSNNRIEELATTGHIGRANRWLNIAGIGDFRGSGQSDIAFVRTPHIGGTLFFYSFDGSKLTKTGALDGFSNHRIGSPEMRLSAQTDFDGDGVLDLVVPSNSRQRLRFVSYRGGDYEVVGGVDLPATIETAIIAEGEHKSLRFYVGHADGTVSKIHQ